jgi:hypothetical protein
MHLRRLDDRIRHLCAQVPKVSNGELEGILQELLEAIHEKIERLRCIAANQLLAGKRVRERRITPP